MKPISADELRAIFPNASQSTLRANQTGPAGLSASNTQPAQGMPLVSPAPGKTTSDVCPPSRYRICFEIYAVRPADYDGYDIKEIQDGLVEIGFIPDDNWQVLEGTVRSAKAANKKEERTEITITQL